MKSLLFAGLLLVSGAAYSQACFSPGPCPGDDGFDEFCRAYPYDLMCGGTAPIPDEDLPIGPRVNCMSGHCYPVDYVAVGPFMTAESRLPSGYRQMGVAGPCNQLTIAGCPSIGHQAFLQLQVRLIESSRAAHH